jgi:hypothetical protein
VTDAFLAFSSLARYATEEYQTCLNHRILRKIRKRTKKVS